MSNPLDREYTTSCGHTWTMRHTACPTCFTALREENARLREALLLKMDEYKAHDPGWCATCDSARAALRGGGGHFKWENGSAVPCKCRGGE